MNGQKNYRKRLEEILLSISFGIAEPNEYKYILSIKVSSDYTGKILTYLTNNYFKIVNQLTNKINDVKQREDLINKLNDFVVVHSKNCYFLLHDYLFTNQTGRCVQIISQIISTTIVSKTIYKLTDLSKFYLLLIIILARQTSFNKTLFQEIFQEKFTSEEINIILSKKNELEQMKISDLLCENNNYLFTKTNGDSESSELLLLLSFYCLKEKKLSIDNSILELEKYENYFLSFGLFEDFYIRFHKMLFKYYYNGKLNMQTHFDFLIKVINEHSKPNLILTKSLTLIGKYFTEYILREREHSKISKLNFQQFLFFLEPFFSSSETTEQKDVLSNLFYSFSLINFNYQDLIWKRFKNEIKQMITEVPLNSKFYFFLTFFSKVYKITKKRNYLKKTFGNINKINNHKWLDDLLILLYSTKIKKKVKENTMIYRFLKDLENDSLKELPNDFNSLLDFQNLINSIHAYWLQENDQKTQLITEITYDDINNNFRLNCSSYINKVEIKIKNQNHAESVFDKYIRLKNIKEQNQMLGFIIIYTKEKNSKEQKHLFCLNKYNKYLYYLNTKEFVQEIKLDDNLKEINTIKFYFYQTENIISKIEYSLANVKNSNWNINFFDINDLIWLKYNDIKNSFDLLLFILQDNFQKFKKLCEFFVIQNEQIKCEEEFNLLRCILQRYPKEYIKSDKNTNDCKKLVDKFEAKKKQRQKYK